MTSPLAQLTGQAEAQPVTHPLLAQLSAGEVPGINVPKDAQMPPDLTTITPDQIQQAGLAVYKPHDSSLMLTVFNPQVVEPEAVRSADAEGKLATLFPSVLDFSQNAGAAEPQQAASEPETAQVPVLPRPASGASLSQPAPQTAKTPSARAVPGGGVLLNSLLSRAR